MAKIAKPAEREKAEEATAAEKAKAQLEKKEQQVEKKKKKKEKRRWPSGATAIVTVMMRGYQKGSTAMKWHSHGRNG